MRMDVSAKPLPSDALIGVRVRCASCAERIEASFLRNDMDDPRAWNCGACGALVVCVPAQGSFIVTPKGALDKQSLAFVFVCPDCRSKRTLQSCMAASTGWLSQWDCVDCGAGLVAGDSVPLRKAS